VEPPERIELSTYSLRVLRLARDPPFHAFLGCHGTVKAAWFSMWGDAGGTQRNLASLTSAPEYRYQLFTRAPLL
jgi:hypothetical protein